MRQDDVPSLIRHWREPRGYGQRIPPSDSKAANYSKRKIPPAIRQGEIDKIRRDLAKQSPARITRVQRSTRQPTAPGSIQSGHA